MALTLNNVFHRNSRNPMRTMASLVAPNDAIPNLVPRLLPPQPNPLAEERAWVRGCVIPWHGTCTRVLVPFFIWRFFRANKESECDWLVMTSVLVASQSGRFFLCSREQIRPVENED
jgi:hypothetical protein